MKHNFSSSLPGKRAQQPGSLRGLPGAPHRNALLTIAGVTGKVSRQQVAPFFPVASHFLAGYCQDTWKVKSTPTPVTGRHFSNSIVCPRVGGDAGGSDLSFPSKGCLSTLFLTARRLRMALDIGLILVGPLCRGEAPAQVGERFCGYVNTEGTDCGRCGMVGLSLHNRSPLCCYMTDRPRDEETRKPSAAPSHERMPTPPVAWDGGHTSCPPSPPQ